MRHRWLRATALGVFAIGLVWTTRCAADVDLTGTWVLNPSYPVSEWFFIQNGTQLTLIPNGFPGSFAGTVDPQTGSFHFDFGGSETLDGQAADGCTLTAILNAPDDGHAFPIFYTGQLTPRPSLCIGPPTPTPTPAPVCGNGVLEVGEQCDDGNQVSGDSCPANCRYTASLIRGDRRNPLHDASACQVEWYVVNPGNALDRFGLPSMKQTCEDQDPTCDFDPTPGRCGFEVVACVHTTDPHLACERKGVARVDVLSPPGSRFPAVRQLAADNVAAVTGALHALHDPAYPQLGYSLAPPLPPLLLNWCSAPMQLGVLSGGSAHSRLFNTMTVRTRSVAELGSPPHKQLSRLRLSCRARRLP